MVNLCSLFRIHRFQSQIQNYACMLFYFFICKSNWNRYEWLTSTTCFVFIDFDRRSENMLCNVLGVVNCYDCRFCNRIWNLWMVVSSSSVNEVVFFSIVSPFFPTRFPFIFSDTHFLYMWNSMFILDLIFLHLYAHLYVKWIFNTEMNSSNILHCWL